MIKVEKILKRRALLVAIGIALLALIGGVGVLGAVKQTTILPGTKVGDVALGGLTQEQATTLLAARASELATLTVKTSDSQSYVVNLAEWGIEILPIETADAAFRLGASNNPFVAGWNKLQSYVRHLTISAELKIDEQSFAAQSAALIQLISVPATNAKIVWEDGDWRVSDSQDGQTINSDRLRFVLLEQIGRLDSMPLAIALASDPPKITTEQATRLLSLAEERSAEPIVLVLSGEEVVIGTTELSDWTVISPGTLDGAATLSLDVGQIEDFVQTLAGRINTEPVDGRVEFRDGTVRIIQESQAGRKLDESGTVASILSAWNGLVDRRIEASITTTQPEVSSGTLANLGLKELIGTATTSYAGSPENRKHNIANGVKYLTSKLVKPGTEFSTITSLGSIDNTTGYLPELVIKENRTIPEYGGGLCQVSTTLFRAALNAGLKITERRNHSYRVSYYEVGVGPGLDATIYSPSPDLKFSNDTPGWILIQAYVTPGKNTVTFELYGTSDGRRSTVGQPQILETSTPGAPIYVETADLPAGEVKQIEKAHDGAKTIVTYVVKNADGTDRFEQSFRSTYKAWQARFLVGTAPVATPAPVVETSPPAA